MAELVRDKMTRNPITLSASASISEAAQRMREANVGAVLVEDKSKTCCGILTDRDIAVRVVARRLDPNATAIGSLCSDRLATLSPDQKVDDALELMRKKAIRRIPIVENGRAVGILSLGDLAIARDPKSVLGGISSAAANT